VSCAFFGAKDLLGRKSINKALPKMAKNATASKLIHAFESHLKETEEHVTRLEKIFESLGLKAVAKKMQWRTT
jgi:ferritin-like metal-binding protein YciE